MNVKTGSAYILRTSECDGNLLVDGVEDLDLYGVHHGRDHAAVRPAPGPRARRPVHQVPPAIFAADRSISPHDDVGKQPQHSKTPGVSVYHHHHRHSTFTPFYKTQQLFSPWFAVLFLLLTPNHQVFRTYCCIYESCGIIGPTPFIWKRTFSLCLTSPDSRHRQQLQQKLCKPSDSLFHQRGGGAQKKTPPQGPRLFFFHACLCFFFPYVRGRPSVCSSVRFFLTKPHHTVIYDFAFFFLQIKTALLIAVHRSVELSWTKKFAPQRTVKNKRIKNKCAPNRIIPFSHSHILTTIMCKTWKPCLKRPEKRAPAAANASATFRVVPDSLAMKRTQTAARIDHIIILYVSYQT